MKTTKFITAVSTTICAIFALSALSLKTATAGGLDAQIKTITDTNIIPLGKTLSSYEDHFGKGKDISYKPTDTTKRYQWKTNDITISGYWRGGSNGEADAKCISFSIFFEKQPDNLELDPKILNPLLSNSILGGSWGRTERELGNPVVTYHRNDGAKFSSGPQVFFGSNITP
jgi:hypothetical protein